MTRESENPFEGFEPKNALERSVLQYLLWGHRHPNALTVLFLGTTALLFVVCWQLFGLIVGVIVLVIFTVVMAGYWLSLRNAARR